MLFILQFLLHSCCVLSIYCATVICLDGEWSVKNSNQSINVVGHVPGGIYTDLEKNYIIGDPYYRFNDIEYRWIGKEKWTYSRSFSVIPAVLKFSRVNLVCDGLDTVSNIYINGVLIGKSDNMFIKYIIDVKEYLKEGNNSIELHFESPVTYAKEQFDYYTKHEHYTVYPVCPPHVQQGECHPNFIRKIQSQFSWDWGPAFPSMGIWKNISIEAFNVAEIRAVTVSTHDTNDVQSKWRLDLQVFLDVVGSQDGHLKVFLNSQEKWTGVIDIGKSEQSVVVNFSFPVSQDVEIWWPNGYGNQPLYNLTVVYMTTNEIQSTKSMNIGFRTVELVQEKIRNATGLSFYLKVNGLAMFMKGSNWIPADSFPERVTVEYTRRLLQSAKDANMNVLRVWGGGMYETEEFYQLADELGIMIWQDFMFACALYPTSDEFLNSVRIEVKEQIQRLQYHPSILIWSGNNENEGAIAQNWWPTMGNYSKYKEDYIKLYIDTIRTLALNLDPTRPFVASSPSNGIETEKEGWIAKQPGSNLYGDVHVYNYNSNSWDWKSFPTARFVSEYGYQSWPSFETLSKVSSPEDWVYNSRLMTTRQHHINGNSEMLMGIMLHMNIPNCNTSKKCNTTEVFKNMLYLTQIYQAMSIKTETEHYLRKQSSIENNEGMTMGALYWQLNDIWQGASWASIEFGGKWKMLHYYAVNFFAPILVSPLEDNKKLQVFGIADAASHPSKLKLTVTVYKWDSMIPIHQMDISYTQKSNCAQRIFEQDVNSLLRNARCPDRRHCFFFFTLTNPTTSSVLSDNFLFLTSFIEAKGMKKPNLKVRIVGKSEDMKNDFELEVKSDAIAPFVWLEATGVAGRFSDNGFLVVNETKRILFHSWENVTVTTLAASIKIQSLLNIY